jgi:hypothetical protein
VLFKKDCYKQKTKKPHIAVRLFNKYGSYTPRRTGLLSRISVQYHSSAEGGLTSLSGMGKGEQ